MTNVVAKSILYIAVAILLASVAVGVQSGAPAHAAGITEMAGDNIVRFYEEEIVGEKFISNMNPARKARTCAKYGISENRYNAVLILQDLGARIGQPQKADELAKMNDKVLISTGKTLITAYIATLTEEEKADLKVKFKSAVKG